MIFSDEAIASQVLPSAMHASVATPSSVGIANTWPVCEPIGRSVYFAACRPPERSTISLVGVVSPRRSSASSVGFAAVSSA